jgi:hypothetical protein
VWPADAYRGPHGKARLTPPRSARVRLVLDDAAAAAAAAAPSPAAPGPRHRAAEIELPPGAALPARAYAERTTLCVTSGCIALVGGRSPSPEAEPLCAGKAGGQGGGAPSVPACTALGGPGAAPVSLTNVGRGPAAALEFVSSSPAEEVRRRQS